MHNFKLTSKALDEASLFDDRAVDLFKLSAVVGLSDAIAAGSMSVSISRCLISGALVACVVVATSSAGTASSVTSAG